MDINASIIDQRLTGLLDEHQDFFSERFKADEPKKRSACFVTLCMTHFLDISFEEAQDCLTEGGNDAGVDGMYFDDPNDGEFNVTLFQGKYKQKLDGQTNFATNDIIKAIHTIKILFDPIKQVDLNPHIKPKIEEIRSFIRDGYIPNVTFVMCNNGMQWTEEAQNHIDQAGLPKEQIKFCFFNHDNIIEIMKKTKTVDDSLKLTGKILVDEAFNYRRVMIGKVQVSEIASLFEKYHDTLLQRNIRRYLGTQESRVNNAVYETLISDKKRENFYFFNNGITIICKNFKHNAAQEQDFTVRMNDMQIINGGQTCKTIHKALKDWEKDFNKTYVLVRIYELADNDSDFVTDITYATNSQNPVDLRDLKSNDGLQKQLEIGMSDLGYNYKRQREAGMGGSKNIPSTTVAEAVFTIWRKKPHQAKFKHREHFGKFYPEIFNNLNASQAIIATLIFRMVENERKRPTLKSQYDFITYASHYISMLIGDFLLKANNITLDDVNHKNFALLETLLNDEFFDFYENACATLKECLNKLYGDRDISLQQLSATFRRGDLLEILHQHTLFDMLDYQYKISRKI